MTTRFRGACLALPALLLLACIRLPGNVEREVVPWGATWRHIATRQLPATGWRERGFDDSGWLEGAAPFGRDQGDVESEIPAGPLPRQRRATVYFRRHIDVAENRSFKGLLLRLRFDDGAAVYLNGEEIFRENLPEGRLGPRTLAEERVAEKDEGRVHRAFADASLLRRGENLIAVEIHQARDSEDLVFDLHLEGILAGDPVSLVRGPYLQLSTPESVVVRFRTGVPTPAAVRFGPAPDALSRVAESRAPAREHVIGLTALPAGERTCYAVVVEGEIVSGRAACFRTAPSPAASVPVRVWVIGDSGTGKSSARAVRDAFVRFAKGRPADVWLTLGDNAYPSGTDAEYQHAVFDTYARLLRSMPLWPTLGNHDTPASSPPEQTGPFFDAFTLPVAGEAGGVASGVEDYYAFDHGNVHFVALDSERMNKPSETAMLDWLARDLAHSDRPWTIAYLHHPPYSRGRHDSDVDVVMTAVRERVVPILEAAGVDLVLGGHSHAYERSALLHGHVGPSGSFLPGYLADGGDGRPDGDGAYRKGGTAGTPGTLYAVVGSSSQVDPGPLDHPAMVTSSAVLGSLVLDVAGCRLDGFFLSGDGEVVDHFALEQETPCGGAGATMSRVR